MPCYCGSITSLRSILRSSRCRFGGGVGHRGSALLNAKREDRYPSARSHGPRSHPSLARGIGLSAYSMGSTHLAPSHAPRDGIIAHGRDEPDRIYAGRPARCHHVRARAAQTAGRGILQRRRTHRATRARGGMYRESRIGRIGRRPARRRDALRRGATAFHLDQADVSVGRRERGEHWQRLLSRPAWRFNRAVEVVTARGEQGK